MARGLFGGAFKGVDSFDRTMEDVKVKTRTGALLTIISAAIILVFTVIEFMIDYRRVNIDEMILVDRSRGERLNVKMNITFPRVPCYLLSLDITDISGEVHQDISHNLLKTRLDTQGQAIHENTLNFQTSNEVERTLKQRPEGYCGSCYGAEPPEGACCQTCESVRQAYLDRGWSFEDPNLVEQCVTEHWTTKIHEQSSEGCRISGRARINKVIGNLNFSPGRSFISQRDPFHDLVPYMRSDNHHDFGHHIHELHFEGEREVEDTWRPGKRMSGWRKKVGLEGHQLDGVIAHATEDRLTASNLMFQYFMKVVSTEFKYLDGEVVRSHQYSVTSFERDLTHEAATHNHERDSYGTLTGHSFQGLPGAFFNFEISPLMVVHRESRGTFTHFVTSLCAIVGGVLMIANIADSMLFATMRRKDGSISNSNAM